MISFKVKEGMKYWLLGNGKLENAIGIAEALQYDETKSKPKFFEFSGSFVGIDYRITNLLSNNFHYKYAAELSFAGEQATDIVFLPTMAEIIEFIKYMR